MSDPTDFARTVRAVVYCAVGGLCLAFGVLGLRQPEAAGQMHPALGHASTAGVFVAFGVVMLGGGLYGLYRYARQSAVTLRRNRHG